MANGSESHYPQIENKNARVVKLIGRFTPWLMEKGVTSEATHASPYLSRGQCSGISTENKLSRGIHFWFPWEEFYGHNPFWPNGTTNTCWWTPRMLGGGDILWDKNETFLDLDNKLFCSAVVNPWPRSHLGFSAGQWSKQMFWYGLVKVQM